MEQRFSLFQSFAEAPFFGFRGIVARSGSEYRVTVAAQMDVYPNHLPCVFVEPPLAGAKENGKLLIDLPWDLETSSFADVIRAVILYIEAVHQTPAEAR